MDITKIGVSKGETVKFKDIVHPSIKNEVNRYIERAGGPENVFRHTKPTSAIEALEEAFKPLEQYRDQIGVVIDGSTTRGFAEPSAAALYAQQLKIKGAVCFDVSEACNGWARGAETAYMLFNTRKNLSDKYILVINNEQPPSTRPLVPENKKDYKAIASYYVGLSFSYVCTCTLFEKSDNYTWKFDHFTDTKYASYICVPLPQESKSFLPECDDYTVDLNEQYGQFIIPKFHQVKEKVDFMRSTVDKNPKRQQFFKNSHVICHTFSHEIYVNTWKDYKFKELSIMYNKFGNLGSCSFPYIATKHYGGDIPKGENMAFCGNAAGGSNVMVFFTHQGEKAVKNLEEKRMMPCL